MYRLTLAFLLALSLLPAGRIMAMSEAFVPSDGLDLSRSFQSQREGIIRALGDGKTYVEIAPSDVEIIKESLARISALLDGTQSVHNLSPASRVEVFNEQERINTLLTQAHADSRLSCRREKLTGTNRTTSVCMTVAERRRAREDAQETMRNHPYAQERLEKR